MAAMVLGIVGGVLAILSGVGAVAWWALSDGLSAASDSTWGFLVVLLLLWGLGAIAVGAAGLFGGLMANDDPRVASYWLLGAGVPGLLVVWPAGLILIVGGFLARAEHRTSS